jgi:hypothetical protein
VITAQEAPLGDVARQARQNKTPRSATVIDNETLERKHGPIPDVALKGPENVEEICAAVDKLRSTTPSKEFEDALHDWYDHHDAILVRIFRQQSQATRLNREAYLPQPNPYRNDDYQKYEEARIMERLDASVERDIMADSSRAAYRIQSALSRLSNRLRAQTQFPWFKVRYNNGSY